MKAKKIKQTFIPSPDMFSEEQKQQFIYLALLQLCSKLSAELEKPVDEILLSYRLFNVTFPCEETDEHLVFDMIKEYKQAIKEAFEKAREDWGNL